MTNEHAVLELSEDIPDFVRGTINLASERLGAVGLATSDEFFAPLSRMLNDEPAVFLPGEYDDNGKWMDGWESRRKRVPGHDWAIIRLAMPGRIFGFDIDTSFFTGNYPPHASIEVAHVENGDPDEATEWVEILSKTALGPSRHHYVEIDDQAHRANVWTHLRLHIYPDGGVARLRVFGAAHYDWSRVGAEQEVDLAYIFHGARALASSDAHYGSPERMLGPGRGINMGDGWETARRRGPGHDWTILKLGHAGTIGRVASIPRISKEIIPIPASCWGPICRITSAISVMSRSVTARPGSPFCRAPSCRWTMCTSSPVTQWRGSGR
jgi:allantoicase